MSVLAKKIEAESKFISEFFGIKRAAYPGPLNPPRVQLTAEEYEAGSNGIQAVMSAIRDR